MYLQSNDIIEYFLQTGWHSFLSLFHSNQFQTKSGKTLVNIAIGASSIGVLVDLGK